jgi:recombination protein RecT
MAVAQMVNPRIREFAYAVVYEGDTFKYGIKNGKKIVTVHEQDIKNVDKAKIVAAYCIALDKEGNPLRTEIFTIAEIHQAWKQSKMKPINDNGTVNENSTHGKFAAEMALKTVINKCCKGIINASSDNALLLERINRNEDLADRAEVESEIEEMANAGEVLEIEANPGETTEKSPLATGMVEEEPAKQAAAGRGPEF